MDRQKFSIGPLSELSRFPDNSAKSVIIFIHGILGSYNETWKDTPLQIMISGVFSTFDYGLFGYKSRLIDFRDPEIFVDELILWAKTNLSQYENIFFVAHSMGGLIVRHAIVKMFNDPDAQYMVRKIQRCFMLASPVTGSWIARYLGRIPVLNWLNPSLKYLADPKISGDNMSNAYEKAARKFMEAGGSHEDVPRFHYFQGLEDKIVFVPRPSFYTDYDHLEGPIPGDHTDLKVNLDINSVLIKRVIQITQDALSRSRGFQKDKIEMVKEATRKREKATLEKQRNLNVSQERGDQYLYDVILISCSKTKSNVAGTHHPQAEGIQQQLLNPILVPLVTQIRSKILRLVQEGTIDGLEFTEGNRASMPHNQKLLYGPDFGGVVNEDRYLPAYARYTGRCYQATEDEWISLHARSQRPHVLIMSGLYGLIPSTEYIQNYDVHLTDVDMKAGINLQSYWKDRELMTQILISHLEWIEQVKGPVGNVIDALSELSYQETINWSMVDKRWNVLHRVFEKNAGRKALGNIGVWLRDVIRNPDMTQNIAKDTFYDNPRFLTPDRIAFEDRIGASTLEVTREVEIDSQQNV